MGAASQELTERAKLLISERRYQEAVRACRRALLSNPGQVEIRLLLGEALLALERYDEVRVEMIALARKAPDRGAVHRLLGEAYLRDGRPTQAVEALRRALQLDPHDEVAQELIAEAADESAPVSTTIERWFADEAEPTEETESPAWEEVHTPLPGATHPPELEPVEPSIQIDPSFVEEAMAAHPLARPTSPGVRSRKPTLAGHTAELTPPPPVNEPLPPPPRRGSEPPLTKQLGPMRGLAPPSAPPPPPPTSLAASRPLPRAAPASRPPPRPPAVHVPSPFAAPPPPRPALSGQATNAARPGAMRELLDPVTDELSLDELDSGELAPVHIMPGEPTRARPGEDAPAPFRFPRVPEPVSEDDSPTLAFSGGLRDADDELTGEPTRALEEELGAVRGRAPAPPRAAGPPPPDFDPPTYDHFPPPAYKSTPFAEPEEPATTPKRPPLVERTPAVPPSGAQKIPAPARPRSKSRPWLLPAITGGLGLVVLGVVVAFGISAWTAASERDELRLAADAAGESGSREAIEAVIASLASSEDEEMQALRARLLATLTLEHAEDHAAEVESIVGALTSSEAAADARMAVALVALAAGDVERARVSLDELPAQGEQIAEAYRAQAFLLSARGEWEGAMEAAGTAVHYRPSSPRHIALHALTGHRAGRTQWALTLLEGTPDAENQPAIRIVRARILADAQSDPAQAVQDATAVIEDLADRATPPQLAWAHLIRASEGEPSHALEEARAAIERAPPGDEAFRLELVRVLLRAGSATEADEQLGRLPAAPVDTQGVALLTAEVALAVRDVTRAESALGRAGSGNRQDLLRAQIYEAQGQSDAARALYQRVMEVDPGRQGRSAAVRLASIEMAAGDSQRVIALLEPRQPQAEDDLELVPLLARAYLHRGRVDDAERVVDTALRRRPSVPVLEAARGSVLLARGRAADALAPLRAAAEALPGDAHVRAELGRAAQLAGHADEATRAFEAALAIDPTSSRALVGLARVAFDAGELDTARTRLEAAGDGGPDAIDVARLRAELEVVRGTGAAGADVVGELARVHRDAVILASLGDLHAQAEQDSRARRAYDSALELDARLVQALIGQALLHIRAGSFAQAELLLTRVTEAAQALGRPELGRARIEAARGWLAFERDDYSDARARADAAIVADPQLSSAHLLLGTVAIEEGEDPTEHLRRAAAARAPSPEALGQLATRLPFGEEACTIADRYLAAAPRGYDAPEVRRVQERCE